MRQRRAKSADDRTRSEPPTNNLALSVACARRKGRGASPAGHARLIHLVDALIEHYVSWRKECAEVASSYENWGRAERDDRALAFTAYLAALDREQLAATSYRRLIAEIAQL
jgi:molybdenum-dependent DNA-binding transcriptional regulator ModE